MFGTLLKWLPFRKSLGRYFLRRISHSHGFIDPAAVISRLHNFGQPAEIAQPLELLRAGVIFHARGLLNTQAIQHNLDWVWPYWVERQFDPKDHSFLPRAFSITHVNLTHRNWTAVGVPGFENLPIVDPRGLVTPFWDGWSLDSWVFAADQQLIPSQQLEATQSASCVNGFEVNSNFNSGSLSLSTKVFSYALEQEQVCRYELQARSADSDGVLIVSLRPYNPEGVSFVETLKFDGAELVVNGARSVHFEPAPDAVFCSEYRAGDVYQVLRDAGGSLIEGAKEISCNVGLATAALQYRLEKGVVRNIVIEVPLEKAQRTFPDKNTVANAIEDNWSKALVEACNFNSTVKELEHMYQVLLRSLILHSPKDVYPGPYTYKRFWFRDAVYILQTHCVLNLKFIAKRALAEFWRRQNFSGYFVSQEGEWDSNGQVLWFLEQYCRTSNLKPDADWKTAIQKAVNWILKKRVSLTPPNPHAGLMPAGFSAEHLGPSDFYYWDDFWSVAGLESAAWLLNELGDIEEAKKCLKEAEVFLQQIINSICSTHSYQTKRCIPASPYRRMDAGAVGSLVAGYPLNLNQHKELDLVKTVRWLEENCFVNGMFFQDMIHSGLNPYLTIHAAQVLLRANEPGAAEMFERVTAIASPTGQWPEAVHPQTFGGCMGDGQHLWAGAEWLHYLRDIFVYEQGEKLILCSGLAESWCASGMKHSIGPVNTVHGQLNLSLNFGQEVVNLNVQIQWFVSPKVMEIRVPGFEQICIEGSKVLSLRRLTAADNRDRP